MYRKVPYSVLTLPVPAQLELGTLKFIFPGNRNVVLIEPGSIRLKSDFLAAIDDRPVILPLHMDKETFSPCSSD
jgi:hypothetical protein